MPKDGRSDVGVKRAPATRVTPARADGRLIAVDKEVGAPFVNEAVLAASGDGLVLFSADDRITYLNPAASEMLGVSRTKLLGKETAETPSPGFSFSKTTMADVTRASPNCASDGQCR